MSKRKELVVKPEDQDKFKYLSKEIKTGIASFHKHDSNMLDIARSCGAMVLEMKEIIAHGHFASEMVKIFPGRSADTRERWMFIAKNEAKVAEALEKFPDVKWGINNMERFLEGKFNPDPLVEQNSEAIEIAPPNELEHDYWDQDDSYAEEDARSKINLRYPEPKFESIDSNPPKKTSERSKAERPSHEFTPFTIDIRIKATFQAPKNMEQQELLSVAKIPSTWTLDGVFDFDSNVKILNVESAIIKPADAFKTHEPEKVPSEHCEAQPE